MTGRRWACPLLLAALSAAAAGLVGCSHLDDPWKGQPGPPRVVVSFAPLYSLVKSVGGDRVGVLSLRTTEEPHSDSYDARQAVLLRKADLVVGIGLDLDASAPNAQKSLYVDRLALNCGKSDLRLLLLGNEILKRQPDLILKEKNEPDPHIWLGLDTTRASVRLIADHLGEIDAAHKDDYHTNAKTFLAKLDQLQQDGDKLLGGKKNRKLVTSHDSLEYFSRSFNLEIAGYLKPTQADSASEKRLGELADAMAKEGVAVIAIEPKDEAGRQAAERLKKEVEGRPRKNPLPISIIEIDPLETIEPADLSADWYLKKMHENLEKLAEALPAPKAS